MKDQLWLVAILKKIHLDKTNYHGQNVTEIFNLSSRDVVVFSSPKNESTDASTQNACRGGGEGLGRLFCLSILLVRLIIGTAV